MISEKTAISLLKVSFWIGALTDGLAIIPMVCPDVGLMLFGGEPSKLGVEYRFAMGIGASLMAGWTILLLWGSVKPIERQGVLVFTLFPVVAGIVVSTIYGVINDVIILSGVIPLWIHLGFVSILFVVSIFYGSYYEKNKINEQA